MAWWACDEAGNHLACPGQQPLLGGLGRLEHVLPLGYARPWRPEGPPLDAVLFSRGAPRRRRPMVLDASLVLMQQPRLPADCFAMPEFGRNLFGLASQVGGTRCRCTAPAPHMPRPPRLLLAPL